MDEREKSTKIPIEGASGSKEPEWKRIFQELKAAEEDIALKAASHLESPESRKYREIK